MARDYGRLRMQDTSDARQMAYAIRSPLHYTTGTPVCEDPTRCDMCSNAARLAVQHYRPIIERRVVDGLVYAYDAGCRISHPGSD